MFTETVYLGRNNTIDLSLTADGSAVDLSSVTKMELIVGSTTISSETPDIFDWNTGVTGKVVISLGETSLTEGNYIAALVVYDPSNPGGIIWGTFILTVVDDYDEGS